MTFSRRFQVKQSVFLQIKKLLLRHSQINIRLIIGFIQFMFSLIIFRIKGQNDFYSMSYWIYKIFGTPLFNQVMVQTNYSCTRKCPFCYYGIGEKHGKEVMKKELFLKIIRELSEMNYRGKIGLFEINEPLTDRNIFEKVKYAVEQVPNAWHHLVTNGDLADKDILMQLSSQLDCLSFSSYDEKGSKKNQANIDFLREKNVKATIDHSDFTKQSVMLTSRGGNVKNYIKPSYDGFFCELSQNVLMITPSGDVLSCWNDFYHKNIIGNVLEHSLKEIWYSKKFITLRKNLSNGNRNVSDLCAQCDYEGIGEFYNPYRQIYLYEYQQMSFLQKVIFNMLSKKNDKLMKC